MLGSGESYLANCPRRTDLTIEIRDDGRLDITAGGYLESTPIAPGDEAPIGSALGIVLTLHITSLLLAQFRATPLVAGRSVVLGRLSLEFPFRRTPVLSYAGAGTAMPVVSAIRYHFRASMTAALPAGSGPPLTIEAMARMAHASPGEDFRTLSEFIQHVLESPEDEKDDQ